MGGFGRLITSGRIMREFGGLGGGRGKGANGSHHGSSQVSGGGGQQSQHGRSTSKSNGTARSGGRPGRSASELTVPPGQVEDF